MLSQVHDVLEKKGNTRTLEDGLFTNSHEADANAKPREEKVMVLHGSKYDQQSNRVGTVGFDCQPELLLLRLGLAEALDFGFVASGEVGLGGAEVSEEFCAHGIQCFAMRRVGG